MSLREQVLAAKSPRDALLVLADAVDRLEAEPGMDSWQGWGEIDPPNVTVQALGIPAVPDEALPDDGERVLDSNGEWVTLHEVTDQDVSAWIGRNYGRVPSDDDEGRALIAMVRADLERAGKGEVAQADFIMHDGVIESAIDFSPKAVGELTADQYHDKRYQFAKDVLQLEVALGPHPEGGDWYEDYAKQGPLPLYIINRDLIIQYPDGVKAAMVADVQNYSPKIAYEMGADLGKQPMTNNRDNPAMAGSWTTDRAQGFVS